ncbi:MAG: membrane-bound ClpP family serine protease [Salibacteraceae bacterium]|jgi:membrane-bound ClpP family serine protease
MDIWIALVLVLFGLIFLILEVFIFPGVGISGVIGVISLLAGVIIAFKIDVYWGLFTLLGSLVGTSVLVYFAIKLDTFSIMALTKNIDSKVDFNNLNVLQVNDQGITISRLAPMGKAEFNNMHSEVSSQDEFIDENTPIKITYIKNNTIFVSPITK